MKITAHACLESMMVDALNDLKSAWQKLLKARIEVLADPTNEAHKIHSEAQIEVDNISARYSELLTARKIIKEMEAKGIEI